MKVLWLILALFGADIKSPDQVAPYRLITVESGTTGKGYAWFVQGPEGFCETIRTEGGKKAVFTGPPGRYAVMLVVSLPDGSLDQGQKYVTVGQGPNPPPVPPPGPDPDPPPDPPDPITKALQVAYDREPAATRAADKKDLVDLYRTAAKEVAGKDFETVAQFNAWMRSAVQTLLKDRLMKVRAEVAAEMKALWPAMTTDLMNNAKAKESLGRLADALEGVR